ncbi:hypothetical protein [Streptomyces sp. NPDC008092]|uniref:hypothetical protein n=1 Tax=Streptomyces sp. NPDC008092 TaxID=3364808 RepID=UPI0036EE8DA4
MSVTHRTPASGRRRLLATAAPALVAATALSGCRDGQGVRDEGPSSSAARLRHSDRPAHSPTPAPAPTSRQTS